MKGKKKLWAFFTAFVSVALAAIGFASCKNGTDAKEPILSVEGVPVEAYVGEKVMLPAASATDGKEGADISDRILLSVLQYKADGELYKEVILDVPGNVETPFTPSGRYIDFKIVYSVKNAVGKTAKKEFDFKAKTDTEAPVLSLIDNSFDVTKGITATATEDIKLPGVKGTDKPLDNDITARATVMVKEKTSGSIVKTITDVTNMEEFRMLAGEYIVTYSLSDISANMATPIEFPLVVTPLDYHENLILDQKNFTLGFDSRFNMFNELEIGKTANGVTSTGMSLATFRAAKVFDEIVALNAKFDVPSTNAPEAFYDIAFRGSKNASSVYPTGQEGEWPPYLVIRFSETGIQLLATCMTQVNMKLESEYYGNLFDGIYHNLFIQIKNEGTLGQDDAKIYVKIWIDELPTNEPTVSAYVMCSNTNEESVTGCKLGKSDFEMLWQRDSGEGWLTFSGASWAVGTDGLFGDDRLTIKGLTIYPANTETFDVELGAPTVNAPEITKPYLKDEEIIFESATAFEGDNDISTQLKLMIVFGETVTKLEGNSFMPTQKGDYKVIYYLYNQSGNCGYATVKFRVINVDHEKPVITVDKTPISVELGESFILPDATVSDNEDGDLTDSVIISVTGPYKTSYIGKGGDSYVIYTPGEHKLLYTVEDFAGNKEQIEIPVTVTGQKTGNLLVDSENFTGVNDGEIHLNGNNEQGAYYSAQYIYEEKVSMVLKVEGSALLLFNLRGETVDDIWIKGLVLKLDGSGNMKIGTYGHDKQEFATAKNPFSLDYNRGQFVLFEYQTQNVIIESEEYLKVNVWFDGKKIEWTPDASVHGVVSEDGSAMIKVADLLPQSTAASAGKFYVTCLFKDADLVIKEIRIDGKSVESDYVSPEPPSDPYEGVSGDVEFKATEKEEIFFGESTHEVMNHLGLERITFKVKYTDLTVNPCVIFQLLGRNNFWGEGLGIKLENRNIYFYLGSWNSDKIAENTQGLVSGLYGSVDDYMYIDVLQSYTKENDDIIAINFEVWVGGSRDNLTKVIWTNIGNVAYGNDDKMTFAIESLRQNKVSEGVYAANSAVMVYFYGADNAGNGAGSVVLDRIDYSDNMAGDIGAAYTVIGNSTTTLILPEAGSKRTSIKMQFNTSATDEKFIFQLAGKEFVHWGNGLVFYNYGANFHFAIGSSQNHQNMFAYALLGTNEFNPTVFMDPDNNDWHAFDYRLTYTYAEGILTNVKIEMWYNGEKLTFKQYGEATNVVDVNGDISIDLTAELKAWNGNEVDTSDKELFTGNGIRVEYIASQNATEYNIKVDNDIQRLEKDPVLILAENSKVVALSQKSQSLEFDLKLHNANEKEYFAIQLAGQDFSATHYGMGLVLAYYNDAFWLVAGKPDVNHTNMLALAKTESNTIMKPSCADPADTQWHRIKIEMEFVYDEDGTTAVGLKAKIWFDGERICFAGYTPAVEGFFDSNGDIDINFSASLKDWTGAEVTDKSLYADTGIYFEYISSVGNSYYATIRMASAD